VVVPLEERRAGITDVIMSAGPYDLIGE
jgi:hypothetical protein